MGHLESECEERASYHSARSGTLPALMGEATPAARPRLVDWLVTPFFLIAFAGSLIAFDPLLRIARLFGLRAAERVGGVLQWWLVRMVFPVAGTRMVVERHPGVRADASYFVISNHQSMFDIPIFGALLFGNRPKYVSKRELASGLPSISYYLRCGGHALIDRDDRAGAVTAIRALAEHVRATASAR
jgi:1-acyl-sn-glycerol-3-phosphate acyltransferase